LFGQSLLDRRSAFIRALKDHSEMMGVDFDAGNWHYLRPEDEAVAAVYR